MNNPSATLAGPDVVSPFAGARFALVGFKEDEFLSIASLLAALGSVTQRFRPGIDALTAEMNSFSAIILALTPSLTESSPALPRELMALKAPLLAVGTCTDLSYFPAIQDNARDLLLRPFLHKELIIRLERFLARAATPFEYAEARAPRVVIADDDPSIVRLVSGILQGRGCECHEAKDGSQALELARGVLPDLLILDINMPIMHGFDVLKALRKDPSTSAMKILLFTGVDGPDAVRAGGELGADSYLCKPFKPFDFLRRVKALLPGSEFAPRAAVAPGRPRTGQLMPMKGSR